jgi:subtilase family serine protease
LKPAQIQKGYDFPAAFSGAGQTIVIVDAFGSPTIKTDLPAFDTAVGLPDPPSFTVIAPLGTPTFNPSKANQVRFAEEANLDVEWAHASAPGANIVLVISPNDQGANIQSVQQYVINNHLGNIMSLSFGTPEDQISANSTQFAQAKGIYTSAVAAGITVIASSGDQGATFGTGKPDAEFPASDPNVLAIGGTQLTLDPITGAYTGESAWNDADGSTGGAPSRLFAVPAYQVGLNGMRTTSDVAFNAAASSGVVVYIGFGSQVQSLGHNGFYSVAGTSQGAPQWAGIIAIANQAHNGVPFGFINGLLYSKLVPGIQLHDVTAGNNMFPAGALGYNAGVGYDLPTGLGTPDVAKVVYAICACPTPTPPPTPTPSPSPSPSHEPD